MRRLRTVLWLVLLIAASPTSLVAQVRTDPAVLPGLLEQVLEDPALVRAHWGFKALSLDTGETIFAHNPHHLFIPASNLKLLTALAAIEELGWDFRFTTIVAALGPVEEGVLKGDLLIQGSGDPTLAAPPYSLTGDVPPDDPLETFRGWARRLKEAGITAIEGDLVAETGLFDDNRLGAGWAWDDLPYGYAAEISALQAHENMVAVNIRPGRTPGELASVQMIPATEYVKLDNQLFTIEPGIQSSDVRLTRAPGNRFRLAGVLSQDTEEFEIEMAVEDPALFSLALVRSALQGEGIRIQGSDQVVRNGTTGSSDPGAAFPTAAPSGTSQRATSDRVRQPGTSTVHRVLFVHESEDLESVLRILLKFSQNLYADTLLKSLDRRLSGKSIEGGTVRVAETLSRAGVPADGFRMFDGSGLSRRNLVAPESIIRILQFADGRGYGNRFEELLPLSGVDGTLRGRTRRTVAAGRVSAKTGSLAGVRSLSGFARTREGERIAFSFLVNNYTVERPAVDYLQDLVLQLLAARGKAVSLATLPVE